MDRRAFLGAGLVLSALAAFGADDRVRLAENGRAFAEIVLADQSVNAARFGALELAAHLKAQTGSDFAVVTDSTRHPDRYPICIGAGVEAAKAGSNVLFRCDGPVDGLRRLRITISLDDLRNRLDLTPVGWVGERRVELCPPVVSDQRVSFRVPDGGYAGAMTYDFGFEPGSIPAHLDAVGYIDRSAAHKWYNTRILKVQAGR